MARRRLPGGRTPSGRRRAAATRRRSGRAATGYQFHTEPGEKPAAKKPRKAAVKKRARARARKRAAGGAGGGLRLRLAALAWAAIFIGVVLVGLPLLLPDPPKALFAYDRQRVVKVFDVNGQTIGTRGLSHAGPVALKDLPPYLPEAVLAVEDRRFYWHMGVDVFGLARAAWENWQAGAVVQGGSTLTQQLVKNQFLTNERTLRRKLDEAVYALWLEQKLTKKQILELYLNKVYLGAGTYGVEAAAQRYFGKSARDVSLVEAALLAGLLKAPSKYAPTASMERASERTGLVLDAMVDAGFITPEERLEAHAMPARIRPVSATASADFILDWVVGQLDDYLGPSTDDVSVWTTIDLNMQRSAEQALSGVLAQEGGKAKVGDGAVITVASDGAVRALVGGRSYGISTFNRAITAHRPPGSAFKPFVYVAALEAGWRPGDVMIDQPISRGSWHPANYSGTYRGAVTLESALANSINTVAVELGDAVGRDTVISTARRFGILSPLEAHASLALGTQEVNLFELSAAYVPFANGGYAALPYSIISIRKKSGELVYSRQVPDAKRIAGPYTIGAINLMLNSAVGWGTGKRAAIEGYSVAGKTGTSGDYRDAWFMGYTADYVTGVWLGNDDNAAMAKVTGGSLPAEVWRRHMASVLAGRPDKSLPYIDLAKPPPMLGAGGFVAANDVEASLPPPQLAEQEPDGLFERIAHALRLRSSAQ